MKILYILSIVLTVVFGIVIFYFADEIQSLRWQMYDEWMYNDYYGDAYYRMGEATTTAALCSLLFIAFYILTFCFTLVHIKRMTAKVMSIIGVSISGLIFLITLIPVVDSGSISFDDFAPVLILFILIMLGFSIVNLVQANRNNAPVFKNDQTIDDLI